MKTEIRRNSTFRNGFTLLEFIVAMTVLGIALVGVFPLIVMQSRVVESLELRYTELGNQKNTWFCPVFSSDIETSAIIPREDYGNWYLVPSTDPWVRKLGAMAKLSRQSPAALPDTVVDNDDDIADDDYVEVGPGWTGESNLQAFRDDRRRHAPRPGGETDIDYAVWTFPIAAPGYYQIHATWSQATDQTQASDACYEIYNGSNLLANVTVRQDILPDGPVYEDRPWRLLATEYLEAGVVQVKLRGGVTVDDLATNGYVVADGVRIVPVENKVHILSLDKSFNSEKVTVRVRVDSP